MAHNRNCTCHDCKSGENAGPSLIEQGEMYYQKTGIPIGNTSIISPQTRGMIEVAAEIRRTAAKQTNSPNGW